MTSAAAPATATALAAGTWQIDPTHSHVEFAVRHLMISTVKGRFGDVSGTVQVDAADPAKAIVDVTINVASIDTREAQRDAHLRSADFFDVERVPTMRFKSTRISSAGDDLKVTGDLTIRDVTREVTLTVTPEGQGKDPWGGVVVGDEIKISIDVELVKK